MSKKFIRKKTVKCVGLYWSTENSASGHIESVAVRPHPVK